MYPRRQGLLIDKRTNKKERKALKGAKKGSSYYQILIKKKYKNRRELVNAKRKPFNVPYIKSLPNKRRRLKLLKRTLRELNNGKNKNKLKSIRQLAPI
jgi:hypothetical protein